MPAGADKSTAGGHRRRLRPRIDSSEDDAQEAPTSGCSADGAAVHDQSFSGSLRANAKGVGNGDRISRKRAKESHDVDGHSPDIVLLDSVRQGRTLETF